MIELRGIEITYLDTGRKIKLIVRGERGDDYKTYLFPTGKKITRGAIVTFLAKEMGIERKDIGIAPHVKIPE